MADEQRTIFEQEFMTFLEKVLNAPATAEKSASELRLILGRLKCLQNAEMNAALRAVRVYVPLNRDFYLNADSAIQDVEESVAKFARIQQLERGKIAREIAVEVVQMKKKTSDRLMQQVGDFIRN